MRRIAFLTTLAAGLVAVAFAAGGPVPRKAPEFAILQPNNGPQTLLSSYKGKVVAMAFMYTTCPHCQKTAGILAQVQKEYAAKGVQILGVTFDQAAAANVKQFDAVFVKGAFPVGYSQDDVVRRFLGLTADEPYFVPILVFIDKTGMIRSEYIGDEQFLGNQEVNIRKELDKLLKMGGAPASATSRTNAAAKPAAQ
jgi:thiol-disulfide isomerase/thioredoxin